MAVYLYDCLKGVNAAVSGRSGLSRPDTTIIFVPESDLCVVFELYRDLYAVVELYTDLYVVVEFYRVYTWMLIINPESRGRKRLSPAGQAYRIRTRP